MKARVAAGWLALCLCFLAAPARAAVTAALSATQIVSGTTVQLTLTYDGLTTSDPDVAPLRADFDILGSSTSTSVQIGTGGSSESTQVVLTLAPKRTGRLTIPPISWDAERSPPLTLTVTGAGSASAAAPGAGTPAKVFIVSRVTPARPYVQQQTRLTVQIYTAEQLYHGTLQFTGNGAVLVKHVGADQYGNAVRNGQTYQVITRRYVLFPQRSGQITLPGPVLAGEVPERQSSSPWGGNPFGGFFGGLMQTLRPIELHGDPVVLIVRPRPSDAATGHWLPASQVTLTAHWSPRTLTAQAGDPLTVTLDLRAAGLTAAQLPDLAHRLAPPAGVSAYPDQAKLANTAEGAGVLGSRDQTIAFIANRPGRYRLPAIRLHWWDTRTNRPRVATLPAQSLNILPAPGAAAAPPAATQATPPAPAVPAPSVAPRAASAPVRTPLQAVKTGLTPWQWLTVAMGALWVATVGIWLALRRRRRPRPAAPPVPMRPPRPDASAERLAFRAACERNDAPAARRHLLGWMAAAWDVPATSLQPLAAASRDPQLSAALRELERACYGGAGWQGAPLAQALRELPARAAAGASGGGTLPPLYP